MAQAQDTMMNPRIEDLMGKGHTERGIGIEDHVAALLAAPTRP